MSYDRTPAPYPLPVPRLEALKMKPEPPAIEIDGVTWREGDIAQDANGNIFRLCRYGGRTSPTRLTAEQYEAHRWSWETFGTEYDWPVFVDFTHHPEAAPTTLKEPRGSEAPTAPFAKMRLVPWSEV